MIVKHILLYLFLLFWLVGCRYDLFKELELATNEPWTVNRSLAQLSLGQVRDEIIVSGVVTTSDSTGNFYKEMFITDPATGEVMALNTANYNLYALYKRGMVVAIRLAGLEVMTSNQMLAVAIPSSMADLNGRIRFQNQYAQISPTKINVDQIDSVNVGTYVELRGVYLQDVEAVTFSGLHTFAQLGRSSTFALYTSPYATFADARLPRGIVNMRAIVVLNDNRRQVKLIDTEDIF